MSDNLLYYGDNLDVLRWHVKDESVDLVYLDPPFKSNQDYPGAPGLFAKRNGTRAAAPFVVRACARSASSDGLEPALRTQPDTWRWDRAAAEAFYAVVEAGGRVAQAMIAFRTFLGENPGAPGLAYLANMAPRLVELRRVFKPTGSIYPDACRVKR